MTKKSDAPAIRFKGFSDAWEQRKLGDISEIKTGPFGSTLHADDYVSDGTPIITTEHFKTSALPRSKNGLPQVSDSDYKRLTAYTLDAGDIVFSRVGSVDINALITPFQSNWLFSGRVLRVRPQTDVSSQFLHTRLETESIKTDIRTRAVGQTMPSINTEILKITPLVLPSSVAEQEQIGSYFAALDNLITLHQRKFEKLKNVKKSMLEKMFPQNGSSYPEIRFKGFTDPWEQRKLTEFVEFFSGLTYTPNDVQENGTLVLRSSNVSNGEVVDADNIYVNPQVVNSENVKVGDIVVVVRNGSRSLIGKHAQIKAFMPNTVIGAFMTGIRSECPEFTNALLNTSRFEEEIAMNMGATINQITGYMFSKMEFKVPCLDEQKKIGEYFEKLDNLITLHQRELEKLQNIKKSMLEKMFV